MTTRIEFFRQLREHIPEEAARLIAEEVSVEKALVTEEHFDSALAELAFRFQIEIEKLRSSQFRWNLLFFVPLWVGVWGTLVTVLVRG